jgi:hypothetical protein
MPEGRGFTEILVMTTGAAFLGGSAGYAVAPKVLAVKMSVSVPAVSSAAIEQQHLFPVVQHHKDGISK